MWDRDRWRWLASPATAIAGLVVAVLATVGGVAAAAQRGPLDQRADGDAVVAAPIDPDATNPAVTESSPTRIHSPNDPGPVAPAPLDPTAIDAPFAPSIDASGGVLDRHAVRAAGEQAAPIFLDPALLDPKISDGPATTPESPMTKSSTAASSTSSSPPARTTAVATPTTRGKTPVSVHKATKAKPSSVTPASSPASRRASGGAKKTEPPSSTGRSTTQTTHINKTTQMTQATAHADGTVSADTPDRSAITSTSPTATTSPTTSATTSSSKPSPSTSTPTAPSSAPAPPCDPSFRPTLDWRGSKVFFHDFSCGVNWDAMAYCESSNVPTTLNATGKYRGMFQFDLPTWQSVGGSGDPAQASPWEQLKRAKMLYLKRGLQPWACHAYGARPEDWPVPGR